MGTIFNNDKPKDKITLSKGGDVPPRTINLATSETSRSFAQPSPLVEEVAPKIHASVDAEAEAIRKNSQQRSEAVSPVEKKVVAPKQKKEVKKEEVKKEEKKETNRTNGALPNKEVGNDSE